MVGEQTVQETGAKITDEGIARMRERIGVVVPRPPQFNRYGSVDAFRHFANGYGDDNPLYCDEAYGAGTPWEGVIAPPVFLTTTGESEVKQLRPEVRARGAHALAGVHEFFAGDEWEWFLPVRHGDFLTRRYYLYSVEEKAHSSFSQGRSVVTRYRVDYTNQHGQLVAVDRYHFVRTERDAAAETKKYFDIEPPRYSDEQIRAIDDQYAAERRQGAKTRYWEDVQEGEELPARVKGPLMVSGIIAWMRGWGSGVRHARLAWQDRQRQPGFYSRNSFGAWDLVERGHWEQEWANKIGNPYPYDFGRMRSCYLSQIVTDWMGDSAWLWSLWSEFRRFNYVGDITWVRGRVTAKHVVEGRPVVDVEVWCVNQRDEITAPGRARVVLPSREHGPAQLPVPTNATEGTVPLIY